MHRIKVIVNTVSVPSSIRITACRMIVVLGFVVSCRLNSVLLIYGLFEFRFRKRSWTEGISGRRPVLRWEAAILSRGLLGKSADRVCTWEWSRPAHPCGSPRYRGARAHGSMFPNAFEVNKQISVREHVCVESGKRPTLFSPAP